MAKSEVAAFAALEDCEDLDFALAPIGWRCQHQRSSRPWPRWTPTGKRPPACSRPGWVSCSRQLLRLAASRLGLPDGAVRVVSAGREFAGEPRRAAAGRHLARGRWQSRSPGKTQCGRPWCWRQSAPSGRSTCSADRQDWCCGCGRRLRLQRNATRGRRMRRRRRGRGRIEEAGVDAELEALDLRDAKVDPGDQSSGRESRQAPSLP